MKIGLIHASNKMFSDSQNYGLNFSPVWANVLASYIKLYGHESILFDLNVNENTIISECDIYFFSGINQDLYTLIEVCDYINKKYQNKKTFLGGPIAWSFKQANQLNLLDIFDHICVGDGELLIPHIFSDIKNNNKLEKLIEIKERFDLKNTISMDIDTVNSSYKNYYGAVIEISRGCPFLCEFCDIRVMNDNNRTHNRNINIIISEMDIYRKLKIKNIQFACDNFIGDLEYANKLVDEIIKFCDLYDYRPSIYTWVTINIANYDSLLKKMRFAGFDNLFIGVESFDNNSLIETAKLQNSKLGVISCLTRIQSYGFIVVAGLIFGFDSDSEESFQSTLNGILESSLLSGDASLLTALPGTPLYRRMKLSNRLRVFKHDSFLGGHKYVTNIKYLLDSNILINGYIKFSKTFLDGEYQFNRLKNYYNLILNSNDYINVDRAGYTDINAFLLKLYYSPKISIFHLKRLSLFLHPVRFYYLSKAIILFLKYKITKRIGYQYFIFWLFIWVNAFNKYGKIDKIDFDLMSVDTDFDYRDIIPTNYRELADEQIPKNKIDAQFKATTSQLIKIINSKLKNN